MPVKITCPHCGQDLRLPSWLYDQPAQCPLCQGAFEPQWRGNPRAEDRDPDAQDPANLDPTDREPCPRCGQPIKKGASKCRHCKEWLTKPA